MKVELEKSEVTFNSQMGEYIQIPKDKKLLYPVKQNFNIHFTMYGMTSGTACATYTVEIMYYYPLQID